MTNHERAEKIVKSVCMPGASINPEILKMEITFHLDEAMWEAIEHHHFTEKCCDACFDSGRDKGFAIAREKAALIVKRDLIKSMGQKIFAEDWLAERIRAMEADK